MLALVAPPSRLPPVPAHWPAYRGCLRHQRRHCALPRVVTPRREVPLRTEAEAHQVGRRNAHSPRPSLSRMGRRLYHFQRSRRQLFLSRQLRRSHRSHRSPAPRYRRESRSRAPHRPGTRNRHPGAGASLSRRSCLLCGLWTTPEVAFRPATSEAITTTSSPSDATGLAWS